MEFEFKKEDVTPEVTPVEDVTPEVVEEQPIVEEVKPVEEPAAAVELPKKKANKSDLVTIRSDRKIVWEGVGSLVVGLNKVTKEEADKWIATKYYVKLVEETNK